MLSKKEVEHIADLARIALSAAEKEKMTKELSVILEFVEKLNELAVDRIDPLSGGTFAENVFREDEEVRKFFAGDQNMLVSAAPAKKDGYVKVKAVFDRKAEP